MALLFSHKRFKLDKDKEIEWVNFDHPPADEPPCGFDRKGCQGSPGNYSGFLDLLFNSIWFLFKKYVIL